MFHIFSVLLLLVLSFGTAQASRLSASEEYGVVRSMRAIYGDEPPLADFVALPILKRSNAILRVAGWTPAQSRPADSDSEVFVLMTPSGVLRLESDTLDIRPLTFVGDRSPSQNSLFLTVSLHNTDALCFIDGGEVVFYSCGDVLEHPCRQISDAIPVHSVGDILSADFNQQARALVVGGSLGVQEIILESPAASATLYHNFSDSATTVAVDKDGSIAVGTATKLWFRQGKHRAESAVVEPHSRASGWRFEWVAARSSDGDAAGPVEDPPRSLLFDAEGTLWIPNEVMVNFRRADGTFGRISYLKGLPYTNASVAVDAKHFGGVAVALKEGIAVFSEDFASASDETTSDTSATVLRFRHPAFYMGNRYLSTDSRVTAMAVARKRLLAVTNGGLAVLRSEKTTFEEKSNMYTKIGETRHNRYGTMNDCRLSAYGDPSTCKPSPGANDGLWTSMYLGGKAFEYAVTKEEETRQICWERFRGLQLLLNVTGIPGLMARSVIDTNDGTPPPKGDNWHPSPTMKGWWWNGDTSSDEVVGHLFAHPLMHDLVCETEEERAEVRQIVDEITSNIVKNGFYLIDVNGNYTTWGRWAPKYLNDFHLYDDNRGLYSLEILAWLKSAHRLTGRTMYASAYRSLTDNFGYEDNLVNLKIIDPQDDNFSDDELTYLSFFTYCWAVPKEKRPEQLMKGLSRQWQSNKGERGDLWIGIYNFCTETAVKTEDALWNLRGWPEELINWPVHNSDRLDIVQSNSGGRFASGTYSVDVLRPEERAQTRWNANPHELDGGDGYSEGDPGAWILPFWLGRWAKLW